MLFKNTPHTQLRAHKKKNKTSAARSPIYMYSAQQPTRPHDVVISFSLFSTFLRKTLEIWLNLGLRFRGLSNFNLKNKSVLFISLMCSSPFN